MHKHSNFAITLALSAMICLPMLAGAQSGATTATDSKIEASKSGGECGGKACFKGGKHHGERGAGWEKFKSTLTPEQQTKIDALKAESKTANGPLFEKMKALREQIKSAPEGDKEKLKEQMQTLRGQMKESFKANHAKFMAVLTDEQKAELEKMRAAHKGGRHHGGFRKGGCEGGECKDGGAKTDAAAPSAK